LRDHGSVWKLTHYQEPNVDSHIHSLKPRTCVGSTRRASSAHETGQAGENIESMFRFQIMPIGKGTVAMGER
jgi:hypothetical protein